MTKTRVAAWRKPNNNFNNKRFFAARAAMDNRNKGRRTNFKIKFLLPQGRDVDVNYRGRVVRRMRVHRKAIFPTMIRERNILETSVISYGNYKQTFVLLSNCLLNKTI